MTQQIINSLCDYAIENNDSKLSSTNDNKDETFAKDEDGSFITRLNLSTAIQWVSVMSRVDMTDVHTYTHIHIFTEYMESKHSNWDWLTTALIPFVTRHQSKSWTQIEILLNYYFYI